MIPAAFDCFAEIWACDFEYHAPAGERPDPICLVARELRTGETIRVWGEALRTMQAPPFDVSANSLFVAYYASAELGCFLALDWPMPARILDLCVEFKNLTCGLSVPCGRGLLGALAYHGLAGIEAAEKESMVAIAIRGGPFTTDEELSLVGYCETDVAALERLLPAMADKVDLPRALFRGRYMAALARMEWTGTPIDVETRCRLLDNWGAH